MRKNVQIGQILLDKGIINQKQLDRAIELQKSSKGKRIGDILIDLSYVSEAEFAQCLSEQLNIPYMELSGYKIDPKAANLVDRNYAVRNLVLPIDFQNNALVVATSDPLAFYTFDELRSITGYEVSTVVVRKSSLLSIIDSYFSKDIVKSAAEDLSRELSSDEEEDEALVMTGERIEGTPLVKLINTLINQAAAANASDIHIEPSKNDLLIRYRINGDLTTHTRMSIAAHNPIITRIKLISDMNIAEKRIPQDGKLHYEGQGFELDIRVSSLPTIYGEKIVMRLLGNTNRPELMDLNRLGMPDGVLAAFKHMIKAPNGIILVTGPTGSGKTTTLYAALNLLAHKPVNIVTIEDPVEQRIDNINQVQVNTKADLTFSSALRSILRQDPDIIMVGEMRDAETASLGIRAAITGHLVLSTLHTNDTVSSIYRLIDMGSAPYMVAASVTGVVAQRLVKELCPHCKQKRAVNDVDRFIIGESSDIDEVYEPVGCPFCSNTGYISRRPIYEIINVDETLRTMIAQSVPITEIKEYERSKGVRFLRDFALDLLRDGTTSMAEIEKIIYSIE